MNRRLRWIVFPAMMWSGCAGTGPAQRPLLTLEASLKPRSIDEIGSGGFDHRVSSVYAPNLADCGSQVAEAIVPWASEAHLSIAKRELDVRRVVIHLRSNAHDEGYFSFKYRRDDKGARASFDFVYNDGHPVDPRGTLIDQASLDKLQERVAGAVICTP